jgi:hypothetical protein
VGEDTSPPSAPLRVYPLIGVAEEPKKTPEPKKYAAKGIEDDDVPYAAFPSQAVVRIEGGKLVVRQRGYQYVQVTQKVNDQQAVTTYQRKSGVHATTHDPADIAVFDMKGNRLSPKAWKEMLKGDVHALIAYDGKLPNPRELTLFKQDTLLVVLPASASPVTYAPRTVNGNTYYVPTVPGTPAVPAPPATHPPATTPRLAPPAPRPAPTPTAPPAIVIPPPFFAADVPENIRGFVTRDTLANLITINVGSDAGLEVGRRLDVYREANGGKYLGTLLVTKVSASEAVCEFNSVKGGLGEELKSEDYPQKGDKVGILPAKYRDTPTPTVEVTPGK